jgi:hypothetical protein
MFQGFSLAGVDPGSQKSKLVKDEIQDFVGNGEIGCHEQI